MEKARKMRGFCHAAAAVCRAAAAVLAGAFLATCDMGLGPTVDLDPPILIVESIVLPNGHEHAVLSEDGGKLFIGPGILFNDRESYLKGRAKDNKEVVGIRVEEVRVDPDTGEVVVLNTWDEAEIGPRDGQGWQTWSIPLHGIRKGERVINITALDKPNNVGPETVKQLTLLVDTDDPIVESIVIERKPGIQVGLLPRSVFIGNPGARPPQPGLSHTVFSNIDYFQNEFFTIRASIVHEFSLSEVWLNFLDADENEIFPAGLPPTNSGSLYTPYWDITEEMLVSARPALATGKHYLNVVITARAQAGHTGDNSDLNSDILYTLCWYPEADKPYIAIAKETGQSDLSGDPVWYEKKGGILPVSLFDDDNLDQVYTAIVSYDDWDGYMSGSSDAAKMESLYDPAKRAAFGLEATDHKLDANWRSGGFVRSLIVPVAASSKRGPHKLIVLAADTKADVTPPRNAVWNYAIFKLEILEEGVPMIIVEEPMEYASAPLSEGTYINLKGNITNLDLVEFFKVAWVPADLVEANRGRYDPALGSVQGWMNASTANVLDQTWLAELAFRQSGSMRAGEAWVMGEGGRPGGWNEPYDDRGGGAGTQGYAPFDITGIKVWNIPLVNDPRYREVGGEDGTRLLGDSVLYRVQAFEQAFDIFADFKYKGVIENDAKFFVLYTRGASDLYQPFRLLAYKTPPAINVRSPKDFQSFAPDAPVSFDIAIAGDAGMPVNIDSVSVVSAQLADLWGKDFGRDHPNGSIRSIADAGGRITALAKELFTDEDGVEKVRATFTIPCGLPEGQYSFMTYAEDKLGNSDQKETNLVVGGRPKLLKVTSDHSIETWFSGNDSVTIKLQFDNPIPLEDEGGIDTEGGVPRLALGGIDSDGPRYAYYDRGAGSTVLDFVYKVEENDRYRGSHPKEPSEWLSVTQLDMNGGRIAAYDFGGEANGQELTGGVKVDIGADKQTELADKKLLIDGVRPVIMPGENVRWGFDDKFYTILGYPDELKYEWHSAGDELTIRLTASKPVRVLGSLHLLLWNADAGGEPFAEAAFDHLETLSGVPAAEEDDLEKRDRVMVFNYTVHEGQEAEPVRLRMAELFKPEELYRVTDKIGTASNVIKLLPAGSGNVRSSEYFVDAVKPAVLGMVRTSPDTSTQKGFAVQTDGGVPYKDGDGRDQTSGALETYYGTRAEYTFDGINWFPVESNRFWFLNKGTDPDSATPPLSGYPAEGQQGWVNGDPWSFLAFEDNMYAVSVRQIDRAGNAGDPFPPDSFSLGVTVSLATVACAMPNGSWPASPPGDELTFKLIFNGAVYNVDNTSTYITLAGGATSTAQGGTTTIYFPAVPKALRPDDITVVLEARWKPAPNSVVYDPIIVTEIVLGGVRHNDNYNPDADDEGFANPDEVYDAWDKVTQPEPAFKPNLPGSENLYVPGGSRDWLKRPALKVFTFAPYVTHIQGAVLGSAVNNVVVSPSGDSSGVTLAFDHAVQIGNGLITVKPAAGWLVPPVLESEDYARIRGELGAADVATLERYYRETTHGLIVPASGSAVPDTATKYVLDFTQGLDHAALRPVFERAKYMWQEIESTSTRVAVGMGAQNNQVTLNLDRLPIGRQWVIEMAKGAFMDAAGNENAEWNSASANGNSYFWSQETAAPVIRVNRVSNNHTGIGIAQTPTSNVTNGTKGGADEVTLRVNVQYRIDCETPGATITSGTFNKGIASARNTTANPANNAYTVGQSTPAGSQAPGPFNNTTAESNATSNSNIPNAAVGDLAGITLGAYGGATGAIAAINNYNTTVGDTDIYTARKDYIAARATRAPLNQSQRAYEGAFKTVIVYKKGDFDNNRFLATEGTNLRNGATTISGFPLKNNDPTGRSLKYCYLDGGSKQNNNWVWITWEIVSDFWHVGMSMPRNTPNGWFDMGGDDPWGAWDGDWYDHNYRRYGNYGIRARNN